MRAAIIDRAGASPTCGDFADPVPDDGEREMRVLAAGIHPIVRSLAAGSHYGSDGAYPRIPGVDAVARGDDGIVRYAGFVRSPWGTIAERIAARLGLPVPADADPALVAAMLNPGLSSWMPLTGRLRQTGELHTVVIVGATGYAGRLAVQNARLLGAARIVGLGRDAAGLAEIAALGAAPVELAEGPDKLARALAGTSPTLILDYAWGPAAELVWECLSGHGLGDDDADILHVELGGAAGGTAVLPAALLRSRRIAIAGGGAGSTPVTEIMQQLPVYLRHIASGDIRAAIRRFPLARVDEAWAHTGRDRAVVVMD